MDRHLIRKDGTFNQLEMVEISHKRARLGKFKRIGPKDRWTMAETNKGDF